MKSIFTTKKRGKKGEGRTTIFKPIQLPVDLVEDLKLMKDIYSTFSPTDRKNDNGTSIPARVSFEQMFSHWLNQVALFDPEVWNEFQSIKKIRNATEMPRCFDVNPFDYPVWEFRYMFETDDGEIAAVFTDGNFVCGEQVEGISGLELDEMYSHNWPLINDAGYEYTLEQAHEVVRKMKDHLAGK